VALIVVALGGFALGAPVLAAPAGGSASVSDTTPQPGQSVTVTASGLLAGREALVDYIPDGVRLAVPTVGPDGAFSISVRIPANTYDGPKQIVVTALDAAGKFTYLPTDLTMRGPPATAELSDVTLVPSQVVRISGNRWFAGTTVLAALFPERVSLGPITAGSDGRFSVDVRLPKDLLNGRHGVQLFGRAAGGRMASVKLPATVTGGVGRAGSFEIPDGPLNPTSTVPSSTTTLRTTTSAARAAAPSSGSDDSNAGVIGLIVACTLLVLVVAVGWLWSADGRQWRRRVRRRWMRHRAGG
jgi:hypothetical protein